MSDMDHAEMPKLPPIRQTPNEGQPLTDLELWQDRYFEKRKQVQDLQQALAAKDAALAQANKELQSWRNVIAVICCDGGHYHQEHGTEATARHCIEVVNCLKTERDATEQDNEQLRAWKESALTVLSQWDAVYKELGKPDHLGSSMAEQALSRARELRQSIVELKNDLAAALQRAETAEKRVAKLEPAVREALSQAQAEWDAVQRHPASRFAKDVAYYQDSLGTRHPQ